MNIYQIKKQKLPLSSGKTAFAQYDSEGDILEIIFQHAEATCAVELTESIVLRFNWDNSEPLSLSFISYSRLLQPAKYGEMYFQLLTDEWPNEAKDKIWKMLKTTPISDFLKVSCYAPARKQQIVQMATIKKPDLFMKAA